MSEVVFFQDFNAESDQEKPVVVFVDEVYFDAFKEESKSFETSFHRIRPMLVSDINAVDSAFSIEVGESDLGAAKDAKTLKISAVSDKNLLSLGYQRHLSRFYPNETSDRGDLSLGRVRTYPDLIEPVLRDVQHAVIYSDAIRHCDIGSGFPTGLTAQEFCEIARIIGEMSICDSLRMVPPTPDTKDTLWIRMYLTFIWYLVEGLALRKTDHPSVSETQQYVVTGDRADIHFVQSLSSGRWWIDTGVESAVRWIACHVSEYEQIKRGETPWRLTSYVV